jgi:hypothetical protein
MHASDSPIRPKSGSRIQPCSPIWRGRPALMHDQASRSGSAFTHNVALSAMDLTGGETDQQPPC